MHPSTRILRRAIATAAVAGAAALAIVVPGAPASAAAACPTSSLEVWLGLGAGGAAAGSTYYPLEFSNIGTATCTLYGYPGVSALGSNGTQLGSPAGWDATVAPSTVTLAPGATAHTVLQITDVGNYPASTCEPATAIALRVYPPNQTASTQVPFSFQACSATGPVYLHVEALQPGVGIPGQA